jgi:RimJ/RimL family protein N-acetyltransferase
MVQFSDYSSTETLRDGRTVKIRAIRPDDRAALLEAVTRASPRSWFRRFFAVKKELSDEEVKFFLDIDFVKHVALVAEIRRDEKAEIVGGGRFVVVRPGTAEVAFAVIDEFQGKGLGTALMRHLTAVARAAGLHSLVADVLWENAAMLKVFEHAGCPMTRSPETDSVHVKLDLG